MSREDLDDLPQKLSESGPSLLRRLAYSLPDAMHPRVRNLLGQIIDASLFYSEDYGNENLILELLTDVLDVLNGGCVSSTDEDIDADRL